LTYYTYSGNTLLSEDQSLLALFYGYAADGLRSADYIPTPNYSALAGAAPNQTSQFDFLYDPQGNLVQRTDSKELGVDQFTAYNAYGYPLTSLPVNSQYGALEGYTPTGVGYGGQYGYYNDGNGLILLGARYYDPGTHRFLNRDPTDYKGGPNLYAFCDGNPVNEIDPSGTSAAALAGPIIWTLPRLAIPAWIGTTVEAIPVVGTIAWGIESTGEMGVYAATRGHLEGPTMQAGEGIGSTLFPPASGLAADPRILLMWQTTVRYYGGLSTAAGYGIQPYNKLRRSLSKTGLQAHHVIEQRFAALLGLSAGTMDSVAVTPAEHQVFTNAWRKLIGYGEGTNNASAQDVINAGRVVYKGYPALLNNVNKLAAKLGIP